MTTLAEMTPEQREQCRGMWVECAECEELGTGLSILDTLYEHEALLMGPNMHPHDVELEDITPRGDLPRAWQADGAPVKGYWEYESDRIIGHGGRTVRTLTSRRFVGEWEGEWEGE